ncbi:MULTISPECIES: hypothetical protein [Methylobacterium]|jgi:hypothetical protein|uniref:Uncharacterized protein n=2 Tax=Methylobacterium ajmalii TaxID=2738439 RepID=A0ABV0A1M1_9HYPH|nr:MULTISPECIES: hypothetical protein [Methylobacterium]MBK3397133.1 hypothetical protein [Methylobacterium ajmalii]MBK3408348.1 hypothetical protein [Methylobacterium ajmalii]MBK3421164.1 hypothetical protein [Methylobacterium ajmalii]MBZ6411075.1 hypothetical protein [Methylobacterium sp.]
MLPKVIVSIELRRNHISICGTPLKYAWSEDLKFLISNESRKLPAVIDPENLSMIYVLEENRRFIVESVHKSTAEMFEFTFQERIFGGISLKLFRKSRRSKKYNDEQIWIDAEIAPSPKVSLLKDDEVQAYLIKEIIISPRLLPGRIDIDTHRN